MQHIMSSSNGRLARTQQDLLKLAMNTSSMKEEVFHHPICEIGFSEYSENGIVRMSDTVFFKAVRGILQARPSAHLWDVVPVASYSKEDLIVESAEGFRMSFEEKAHFLTDEFLRRPKMVGFRLELHNVGTGTTDSSMKKSTVSISVYETTDELDDVVPVEIKVRYRSNF